MKRAWRSALSAGWIVLVVWGGVAPAQDNREHSQGAAAKDPSAVPPVVPLKLSQRSTTVDFPATIEDAVVGGGGRYLIFDLRSLQKLAVLDVSEGKIAGYVPLEGPKELFAAGAEKLMVVDPQTRTAKRFSLVCLKQEAAQRIPCDVPIVAVGMGAASRGPLLVACSDSTHHQFFALDPATFQLSEITITTRKGPFFLREDLCLSVSADGSVLGGWGNRMQPSGMLVAWIRANQMECSYQHVSGGYVCPDDHGERVYTGRGLLDRHGEPLHDDDAAHQKEGLAVPAVGGPYYLTVPANPHFPAVRRPAHKKTDGFSTGSSPAAEAAVRVYRLGQSKPAASLSLEDFRLPKMTKRFSEQPTTLCRRLFLIPAAEVIAEVPETRNAVVLHHVELDGESSPSGAEELRVVSHPPGSVRVGETFRYQIRTNAKSGKPGFKLEAGPEGMVVSQSGLVEWTPPRRPPSGKASAVISITDSGQSEPYAIVLAVQPPEERPGPGNTGAPSSASSGAGVSSDNQPAGDIRVKLPATYDDVCVGGAGQFLVFRLSSLDKLAVFDVFAAKIVGYVPFEGKCFFAAGVDKLVVVDAEKLTMQRFDLATQKREAARPLPVAGRVRLVAMGSASQGPVLIGMGDDLVRQDLLLLNLDSLEQVACEAPQHLRVGPVSRMWASAPGRVFAGGSQSGLVLLAFDGRKLTQAEEMVSTAWAVPDEKGERIYTSHGAYTSQLIRPGYSRRDSYAQNATIPAVHGPLYLLFRTFRLRFL